MPELRLGHMKTNEIADWMGVGYDSFRRNAAKRYNILKQYCSFSKVYGGINIHEIYIPEYYGDLTKTQDIDNYVNEIRKSNDGLSSVTGMARYFSAHNEDYKDLTLNSIIYRLTKAGETAFGKNVTKKNPEIKSGIYGYRELVWAIKLSDNNEYRLLSAEEDQLFSDIVSTVMAADPEKVKQSALLETEFRNNSEMTKEEYLLQRERLELDSVFFEALQRFKLETGLTIVHCSQHYFTDEAGREESAF